MMCIFVMYTPAVTHNKNKNKNDIEPEQDRELGSR